MQSLVQYTVSLQAMRLMIEGIGAPFAKQLTPDLLNLLYRATRHPNRFIRETSYHTLAAVCSFSAGQPLHEFGREVATCLQDGLSENWSQVDLLSLESLPGCAFKHPASIRITRLRLNTCFFCTDLTIPRGLQQQQGEVGNTAEAVNDIFCRSDMQPVSVQDPFC